MLDRGNFNEFDKWLEIFWQPLLIMMTPVLLVKSIINLFFKILLRYSNTLVLP